MRVLTSPHLLFVAVEIAHASDVPCILITHSSLSPTLATKVLVKAVAEAPKSELPLYFPTTTAPSGTVGVNAGRQVIIGCDVARCLLVKANCPCMRAAHLGDAEQACEWQHPHH